MVSHQGKLSLHGKNTANEIQGACRFVTQAILMLGKESNMSWLFRTM